MFFKLCKLTTIVFFLFTTSAYAGNNDYYDAKVTGVGLYITGSALKFTIDKTGPLVWTTDNYSGDQLKHLITLIVTAYVSGKKVAFIRTFDDPSVGSKVKVAQFELGTITH